MCRKKYRHIYKMVNTVLSSFILSILSQGNLMATSMQDRMYEDFQFITNTFDMAYAPTSWKHEFFNWSLAAEREKAKARIYANENITVEEYQQVVKDFFISTKDYHVGYRFASTEAAKLNFTVRSAGDKYHIVYIDRDKLTEVDFPYQLGDELIAIDGEPIGSVVTNIRNELGANVEETDAALAELYVTSRSNSKLMHVPKGPVELSIKSQADGLISTRQLMWDYKAEVIKNNTSLQGASTSLLLNNVINNSGNNPKYKVLDRKMLADESLSADLGIENPYGLGLKDSYLPALGTTVWESAKDDLFQAYIYKHETGKLIGVVRIPQYIVEDYEASVSRFAEIIAKFETVTDALVIDQLNNPGGSVFYLYALASTLTTKPLATPKHVMSVNQIDAYEYYQLLETVKNIETDEDAKNALGSSLSGYPTTVHTARFIKDFAQFMIDEWNSGKRITSPYFLYGADQINPHSKANYTKPILVLVNSLDFSGGDFFPTILQDNKRAKIMGVRTAGAGGYVASVNHPNVFGLLRFSYTGSIAERTINKPIENLGVSPDIKLEITSNDLTNNFVDYISAVNTELKGMLAE